MEFTFADFKVEIAARLPWVLPEKHNYPVVGDSDLDFGDR